MARVRTTTRKLYVFSLHAHRGEKPVGDYKAMFEMLAKKDVRARAYESTEKLVAVSRIEVNADIVKLTAYEGPPGLAPLLFDLNSDSERIAELRRGEVMATRTHAAINLKTRDVVVEYNHRGAKAADIARVLQEAGRATQGWEKLKIELVPVAAPSFANAIDEFERVRIASLNIIRPNTSWVTEKNHAVRLAQESKGRRVEVAVYAEAGDSLNKNGGIVKLIKGLTGESRASLKNASVTGVRAGESAETKISLEKHLEHRIVTVRVGTFGHVETGAIDDRLLAFLKARDTASRKNERA